MARLRDLFILGERRTFDQDPRFGLVVLGQIAAKALSPGVRAAPPPDDRIEFPHLRFSTLETGELLDDLFTPIATYGARDAVVAARLQQAFAALAGLGDAAMTEAACAHSALALERAMATLELDHDRERARRAAATAKSYDAQSDRSA